MQVLTVIEGLGVTGRSPVEAAADEAADAAMVCAVNDHSLGVDRLSRKDTRLGVIESRGCGVNLLGHGVRCQILGSLSGAAPLKVRHRVNSGTPKVSKAGKKTSSPASTCQC